MSSLIPLATYNLNLQPFNPVPAIEDDFPVTIRITLASLDPEAADDKAEPSTLRILKKSNDFLDDLEDLDAEEASDEEDELDDEEDVKPKRGNGKKNAEEEDEEDEEEDDEDDEDDEEGDISEYVVCTLSPKIQYQQTLDLTITPSEEVYFVVTGSYPIHLTGNYVQHPADEEDSDEDYDEDYDEDEDNLTPDEDEIIYGAPLDDDEIDEEYSDEEDSTPKIEEIEEELELKETKKRAAEEPASKKSKKAKKNEKKEDKKSVQFTKELEQGPTGSTLVEKKEEKKVEKKDKKEKNGDKKFPTKTLLGGVVTEDRKAGSGPLAKSGSRVGIRYIGKLKNGQVFDKNTSGKPFSFKLGKGECIKGFDLGVTGMAVGGERRVVIPPKMGYGSQALPGIPANSELTFDIKLVSLK